MPDGHDWAFSANHGAGKCCALWQPKFFRERIRGFTKGEVLSEHPTSAELTAFAHGDLPRRSFPRIARHVLRCSQCRALLAPHYAHLLPAEFIEPSPERERVHDGLLDRAFSIARAAKRQIQREEARRRRISALLAQGGGAGIL